MATRQGAALERKKLLGDPILVTTIVVLIAFLTLFILFLEILGFLCKKHILVYI